MIGIQKEALDHLRNETSTWEVRRLFAQMGVYKMCEVLFCYTLGALDKADLRSEEYHLELDCPHKYKIDLKYYPCGYAETAAMMIERTPEEQEFLKGNHYLEIGVSTGDTPEDIYWIRCIVNKKAPLQIESYFKRVRRAEEVVQDIINNV